MNAEHPQDQKNSINDERQPRPGVFNRWMGALTHFGLGETAVRAGTDALSVVVILAVAFSLQAFYKNAGASPSTNPASAPAPTPSLSALLPVEASAALDGIPRQAILQTIFPTRSRDSVLTYTVQPNDTVFGIAQKYDLQPSTILFGNFNVLSDNPDNLQPGQVLNILPVDGVYYQWTGVENLNTIAKYYGVVGYGTFIFPTVDHWLSGTDYRPDINHYGVDFAGSLGSAVYAVDAGVVVYAGWNTWGYGNLIVLDHGNGWQSLYAHLSQINVKCGQSVGQGDVIGLIGATGNATGPHLHFEVSYKGAHVNPHSILVIQAPPY